jgi:PEP-CTERM motif
MKIWMTTTSVVVALASAAPAMAGDNNGFGVGTSASTGQYLDTYGGVASSTSAYRMGQDSSGNYTRMGDVAPVSSDNCVPSGPIGCLSASHSGTTGPGFDQTRSTSDSGLVYNGGYGPWTALASTYADLSTGKIGANGSTDYYQTAFTVARFADTLNFNVAGADASTVTNIVVKFQLDGSLSTPAAHGASGLGTPYATITDTFGFGAATGSVNFEQIAANRRYGQEFEILNTRNNQTGWVSYSWDTISPGLTQFTGVYALSGISQVLGIGNSLSAYASTGASFAYGNTSALSFVLPDNVTFTSASGVFLSALNPAGPGAVPEPATWAMMLLGFGLVGSTMRRRAAIRVSALA